MQITGTDNGKSAKIQLTSSSGLIVLQLEDGRRICMPVNVMCDATTKSGSHHTGGYLKASVYSSSGGAEDPNRKRIVEQRFRFFSYNDPESIRIAVAGIAEDQSDLEVDAKRGRSVQVSIWGKLENESFKRIGVYPRAAVLRGEEDGEGDDGQGA